RYLELSLARCHCPAHDRHPSPIAVPFCIVCSIFRYQNSHSLKYEMRSRDFMEANLGFVEGFEGDLTDAFEDDRVPALVKRGSFLHGETFGQQIIGSLSKRSLVGMRSKGDGDAGLFGGSCKQIGIVLLGDIGKVEREGD